MVKKTYTATDIEILKGIEPVQKRPGMYTDTSTPNHLLQEVIAVSYTHLTLPTIYSV